MLSAGAHGHLSRTSTEQAALTRGFKQVLSPSLPAQPGVTRSWLVCFCRAPETQQHKGKQKKIILFFDQASLMCLLNLSEIFLSSSHGATSIR